MLTVETIKNAWKTVKLLKEESRERWCSPETIYHRGERHYILRKGRRGYWRWKGYREKYRKGL